MLDDDGFPTTDYQLEQHLDRSISREGGYRTSRHTPLSHLGTLRVAMQTFLAPTIRVLIVEDEPTIARAHARVIRKLVPNVDITTASSAEFALLHLGGSEFDRLAGAATGADVLAFIRRNRPTMAFLFVSSDERIRSLGAAWVEKPCTMAELSEAIAEQLGGGK